MMLDRMRRFAEAQDERSRKNHARKLDNLRRSLKAPFLVGYSRFFYFLTIGGTAGIFLAETASWLKYGIYSADKYLQNASFSMFLFWLIFGGTAFLLSLARFFQLQKSTPQEAEEDEEDEETPDPEKAAAGLVGNSSPRRRPETLEMYLRRFRVCLIGAILLFLFCLIMRLL